MFYSSRIRLTAVGMLVALLLGCSAMPVLAQESKEEQKLRKQQEEADRKARERAEKDQRNRTRNEKQYQSLLDFGLELYSNDSEFKDNVDEDYLQLLQSHAMEAFAINTGKRAELARNDADGDKFEVRRTLYDNPRVQDYVNRLGQRLVPAGSDKLFAFKVVYSPIPYAYTLSTGTVLVSTGLVSLLDNEAQLAYVLAHELGHVHSDHWKTKIMMALAEDEYNAKQARKRAKWGMFFAGLGAVAGGAITRDASGAMLGAIIGGVSGYAVAAAMHRQIGVDWDKAQEDAADQFALQTVLDAEFDASEAPKVFASLEGVAKSDSRAQLGFIGSPKRLRERRATSEKILSGPLSAKVSAMLGRGGLQGTSGEYSAVMATLKRDNGIEAFRYDMLELAKKNLEASIGLLSNDALANYYLGRVLRQVGRTDQDLERANQYMITAVRLDTRNLIPDARLQQALAVMSKTDSASQSLARTLLKDYVASYQAQQQTALRFDESLPVHMALIYDYLRNTGEPAWVPSPPTMVRLSAASDSVTVGRVSASDQPPPVEEAPKAAKPRRRP